MDSRVIEQGIHVRYRDFQAAKENPYPISGADYLEKIIQVPFHLPPIAPENLRDYIDALFRDCAGGCPDGMADIFVIGLEPNPRKVKRAINVFRILWTVARRREEDISAELMAKLVVIQTRSSELFAAVKQNPAVLQVLEERNARADESKTGRSERPLTTDSPLREEQRNMPAGIPL